MDEKTKKVAIVAFAVVALGAAAFSGYRALSADSGPQIEGPIKPLPPGWKSGKQEMMEAEGMGGAKKDPNAPGRDESLGG